jgi:hypothetical protein
MAWESKQRGGQYYYRSRRVGDTVIKQYVGTGPEAERAAAEDQRRRELAAKQRKEVKMLEAQLSQVKTQVESVRDYSELLIAASLLAAGFHYHRGEWRKSNDCKS